MVKVQNEKATVSTTASFKVVPKTVNKRTDSTFVRRGEIYIADMGEGQGSEQTGLRPVLILQNDMGNKYSTTTIVATITSKMGKASLPTHIEVGSHDGLERPSIIMLEQVRTIDKARLKHQVTSLKKPKMQSVEIALRISLGLD